MPKEDDGPASVEIRLKPRQIDRSQIVRDIAQLILVMPLTTAQIDELYEAILRRKDGD